MLCSLHTAELNELGDNICERQIDERDATSESTSTIKEKAEAEAAAGAGAGLQYRMRLFLIPS